MKTKLSSALLAGLALTLAGPAHPTPADRATPASPTRSEAETWIIKQVEVGEIADLSEHFPKEDARVLPASFVVALLTDALPGVKPQPSGIRILGAVFEESLVLDNLPINHEVWLDHCMFKAAVSGVRTNFLAMIQFDSCTFSGEADFNSVKVGATAFFRDTVFAGPVDFASAEIASQFHVEGSRFQDRKDGAIFNAMKVGKSAFFNQAFFAGPANFGGAEVSGQFLANEVRFGSEEGEANFYGLKVGGLVSMQKTVFAGPVVFAGGDITGQFLATGARFQSPVRLANFNALKVGGTVFLDGALFAGPVDFTSADIGGQFRAEQARFEDPSKGAIFNGIRVGKSAEFNQAVFAGPVNFGGAQISSQFLADEARFENVETGVNCFGLQVKDLVSIKKAVFSGPVNFGNAEIGSQLLAEGSQFLDRKDEADFNGLEVEHSVFFNDAIFAGPVDFAGADLANEFHLDGARFQSPDRAELSGMKIGELLSLKGAAFAGPVSVADSSFLDLALGDPRPDAAPIPQLDLSRVSIKRRLDLGPLRIHDLVAPSLHVEGAAFFTNVQVEHAADLSDGDFNLLDVSGSQWPAKQSGQLRLQGTHYKSIRANREAVASHEGLLKLVDQAAYGADVYGNLEAFFVREGYTDDANRAYVAGRSRERGETLSWHSFHPLSYAWDLLLQGIGYGRYPERAVYVCILIVSFGCWVFKPAKMEPQQNEDGARQKYYNRFWYSLELFLPLVELKAVDAWEPKVEHRFLRHYMRIHTLLGWILIPIALGSVTGLIK